MMKNLRIYILMFNLLAVVLNFSFIALAQEAVNYEIVRPQIKYKSGNLRDPFASVAIKEEVIMIPENQEAPVVTQPKINLETIEIQGIVWGGKIPRLLLITKF